MYRRAKKVEFPFLRINCIFPSQNLEYLPYVPGKIVGDGLRWETSQIHRVSPVPRFTTGEIPISPIKMTHPPQNLEYLPYLPGKIVGDGWGKNFSNPQG